MYNCNADSRKVVNQASTLSKYHVQTWFAGCRLDPGCVVDYEQNSKLKAIFVDLLADSLVAVHHVVKFLVDECCFIQFGKYMLLV